MWLVLLNGKFGSGGGGNSSLLRIVLHSSFLFSCPLGSFSPWDICNELIPGQETLSGREKIALGKHIIFEHEKKDENS